MEDVGMMDWQATPPAADINALYDPVMLERRRPRGEFEIPNMPGGWVDYYTERQFNVEDVVQFQHLARPSIITCTKQAVGNAKRRCVQMATSAYQGPIYFYTIAQTTTQNKIAAAMQFARNNAPSVNQIVRRVRRHQADRRRRPASPRNSPRNSPRPSPRQSPRQTPLPTAGAQGSSSIPLIQTPFIENDVPMMSPIHPSEIDVHMAATTPTKSQNHPSETDVHMAAATPIKSPIRSSEVDLPMALTTPTKSPIHPSEIDVPMASTTPIMSSIHPSETDTPVVSTTPIMSSIHPSETDTPVVSTTPIISPRESFKTTVPTGFSTLSSDLGTPLGASTPLPLQHQFSRTAPQTPQKQIMPYMHGDPLYSKYSPVDWLNASGEVNYIGVYKPPQKPMSPRTAAENQLLTELEDVSSSSKAHDSTSPQEHRVTPQRKIKPYPSYMEGEDADFSSNVPDTRHDTTELSSNCPFSPEVTITSAHTGDNTHTTPTVRDLTEFSSNCPFPPEVTDASVHTAGNTQTTPTVQDLTEFSSNCPFPPEISYASVHDSPVNDTPHDVTEFSSYVVDFSIDAALDPPIEVENQEFSSYVVDFSINAPIDTPTEEEDQESSYYMDFPSTLPSDEWYSEPAPIPFCKSSTLSPRRVTRGSIKREAEEQRRKEESRQQNLEKAKISALSKEWENKVKQAVRSGFAPDYTAADFARVAPPQRGAFTDNWLNDESVNGYLKLATKYHNARHPSPIPKSHAFSSFLFKQIAEKGYDSVKRWATRAKIGGPNLLTTHTIFIPVNNGSHWTLMVVYPGARTAHYYDSMGRARVNNGRQWFNLLKQWLRGELGTAYNDQEWSFFDKPSPQQDNSSDCGVFAVTTAKMLILGAEVMGYGPEDIPLQRRRMVAELVNGDFL